MTTVFDAQFSEIPPFVLSVLGGAKGQPVTGTQLREFIKFKFPAFNPTQYGCRNLRDFLHQYVPDVKEVSRSGMDFVYGLRGAADEPALPTNGVTSAPSSVALSSSEPLTSSEAAIWKTFASPRSEFRLFADPETGVLTVVRPGGQPSSTAWKEVPSCTAEKHIEIAKAFISTIGEHAASQLTTQFDQPNWWLMFYDELKRLGLAGRWNTFRRERVLEELRAALGTLGVPVNKVPSSAAVLSAVRPGAANPSARNARPAVTNSDTARLRRLAAAIVTNMSVRELRELPVRLGDVVDVLDL